MNPTVFFTHLRFVGTALPSNVFFAVISAQGAGDSG